MSASLRKRTKQPAPLYVRFVPEATQRSAKAPLLDQLVLANEKGQRQFKPKRFGGLEVYKQLDFGGLLDGEISRLGAFENSLNVEGSPAIHVDIIRAVGDQCAVVAPERPDTVRVLRELR